MNQHNQNAAALLDELYLRLPDGMRHRLEALSASHGTTVQAEVLRAVEEYLANQARLNILAMTKEAKVAQPSVDREPAARHDTADIDYLDGLNFKSR